ncbi:uncharacterized protein [Rutidosis leptorrhynchoides]|uniref:uncharacterized protein n=1 Tax=Rutidosis leptorrhynchoides TaxID=125765 RepID=UPI003A99C668
MASQIIVEDDGFVQVNYNKNNNAKKVGQGNSRVEYRVKQKVNNLKGGKKSVDDVVHSNKYATLNKETEKESDPLVDKRSIVDEFVTQRMQPMASWNIRGMNTKNKKNEIRDLLKNEQLSLVSVLETHLNKNTINDLCGSIFGGWNWVSNVSHSPNCCRIVVGWNSSKLNVMVLHMSRQTILCLVESVVEHRRWYCSIVYASNNGKERKKLWNDLNGGSRMSSDMIDFNDCVNSLEVEDVGSTGFHFTWTKSLKNPKCGVLKKLDRIMANEEFLSSYQQASIVFHPYLISDHSPAVMTIPKSIVCNSKSFRFMNFLADKEEFLPIVSAGWSRRVDGYHMYFVVKRLKLMKKDMKKLNWSQGNVFTNSLTLKESLRVAQKDVDNMPYDVQVKKIAVNILHKYNEAVSDELKVLLQQAKIKWLKEGDKNTKFFHSILRARKNKNRVDTDSVNSLDGYEDIFTTKLTTAEASIMVTELTYVEIKQALFDIDDNKPAGPDGYSSLFFKKAWDVIGKDGCLAIKEFFSSGKLLGELNATLIALVPKIRTPNKVSDFRLIAC